MRVHGTPIAPPATALRLANDTDVLAQADAVARAPAVALHFPKWTDGRAYSQARLLRSRLRFAGEIWATGEVLVDMLPLLQRSGFDVASLAEGQRHEDAEQALRFFAGHYQADLLSKLPQFGAARAWR